MFAVTAIPVLTVAFISVAATGWILATSTKGPWIVSLIVGSVTGFATYFLALAFGFLLSFFGLGIGVADAFLEECLKAPATKVTHRFCNPAGVTAAFGSAEVVGKYYFIFLLASPQKAILIDNHMIYLVCGISGAFLMHLATGIFYSRIGLYRGFVASVVVHSLYNLVGLHFDKFANTLDGILLFVIATVLIVAALGSKQFFFGSRQQHALDSPG